MSHPMFQHYTADVQKWLQALEDDIILLQETHLDRTSLHSAVAAMHKAGFEMVGGEASPTIKKGTNGRVAVLSRSHLQTSTAQHYVIEGRGYCAVEVRGLKGLFTTSVAQ